MDKNVKKADGAHSETFSQIIPTEAKTTRTETTRTETSRKTKTKTPETKENKKETKTKSTVSTKTSSRRRRRTMEKLGESFHSSEQAKKMPSLEISSSKVAVVSRGEVPGVSHVKESSTSSSGRMRQRDKQNMAFHRQRDQQPPQSEQQQQRFQQREEMVEANVVVSETSEELAPKHPSVPSPEEEAPKNFNNVNNTGGQIDVIISTATVVADVENQILVNENSIGIEHDLMKQNQLHQQQQHHQHQPPLVIAEKSPTPKAVNFHSRRVRLCLLLILIIIVSLIVALVLSLTSLTSGEGQGSSNGSDDEIIATTESPTPSSLPPSPTTASPTPSPTVPPSPSPVSSSSWKMIGSALDFAPVTDTQEPQQPWPKVGNGPKIQITESGKRLMVGASRHQSKQTDIALIPSLSIFELQQQQQQQQNMKWNHIGRTSNFPFDELEEDATIVAISGDGNRAAVRVILQNGRLSGSSAIRVVRNIGSYTFGDNWELVGNPITNVDEDMTFGQSASMSHDGTVLAIGSHQSTKCNGYIGSVQVFQEEEEEDGEIWSQRGPILCPSQQQPPPPPPPPSDSSIYFGYTVVLSANGNRLAIAPNQWNKNDNGNIYTFEYDDTQPPQWKSLGNPIPPPRPANDEDFDINEGQVISMDMSSDGNTLAIGMPNRITRPSIIFDTGRVLVYQYKGGEIKDWKRLGNAIDLNHGTGFGTSVSITKNGQCLAVGAPGALDDDRRATGQVMVYQPMTTTSESEEMIVWKSLVSSPLLGEVGGEEFGSSVSLSKDCSQLAVAAAGSRGADGAADSSVRIYQIE